MAQAAGWAGNPPSLSLPGLALLSTFTAGPQGAWSALGVAKNRAGYCQGALQWGREGTGRGTGCFAAQAWEGRRGMEEDAADVSKVAGQERR